MKIQPKEKLQGKRIFLERLKPSFEIAHLRYQAIDEDRKHLLPWLPWARTDSTKSAEDYYNFMLDANSAWEKGEEFEFSIYKKDGTFIGAIGFYKRGLEESKNFEIGFWLKKEACGNGYMQEAVQLIEEELFSLGAERIIIRNDTENKASESVAKSLGYHLDGIMRHDSFNKCLNKFTDTNVFSKLKSD